MKRDRGPRCLGALLKQIGDRDELVALITEFLDDERQCFMGLLHRVTGVHQHDISRMSFGDDAVDDFLDADVLPIPGVGIPLDHRVVQALGDAEDPFVKIPFGIRINLGSCPVIAVKIVCAEEICLRISSSVSVL